jgi:hypothetical protein
MWVRQLKLSASQKIMALNSPVIHPKGYPDFPINGLSFYPENVELVRSRLYLQDGDRTNTQAVLLCDPDNPHSKSGTAVAVYLHDRMVGHVPAESSAFFFQLISEVGGIARSEAVFYYSSEGRSACRLDVGFPPSWDSPIEGLEPDYLDGDGTFSFRMRSAKYPIDWERVKTFNPEIYLEVGETYKGAGYLTKSDYGRSPYLDTDFEEITAKPFEADESLVDKVLASVGGRAKVEFVLTRISEKSHKTKLDLDLSRRKKARETQSKKLSSTKRPKPPGPTYKKKRRSKRSVWMKILFGKPKRKKSIWRGLFFGD